MLRPHSDALALPLFPSHNQVLDHSGSDRTASRSLVTAQIPSRIGLPQYTSLIPLSILGKLSTGTYGSPYEIKKVIWKVVTTETK